MAFAAPEGGSRKRSSARSSNALGVLASAQQTPLPPMPSIELLPLPNIPPPQPVAVPNPLAALGRALADFPLLPSPTLLQTLVGAAQGMASDILQSRLQAQEQALQRALGLANLGMERARIGLEAARQRLELEELRREEEEERRRLALNTILNIINDPAAKELAVRAQLETLFAVYPELRSIIPQSQIEAMLRARFGESETDTGGRSSGPTLGSRIAQHLRSLPGAMARDFAQGGELLNNLLRRLSFDYVMGHRR